MAKCVPSGVYGRLKDQAASILEKLKLAYDVWFAKSDVLPNKHQIIIDTVVGFLLNKKKKFELTQEEEKQVWNNLYEFLSSKDIDECGKYGSTLLIKPSLAQVILDYLETCITEWESVEKHGKETLSSVIGCCRVIIGTSSLSYVLTSRPEVLIALTGSLCQLWHLGQVSENSESEVSVLLSEQCKHLWYHLRCHPNQAQMLKVVTEKLLLPVVHLVHDVKTITRLNKFKVCVESLQEFVVNTVFHEDHERLVKTFLDVVTKHQDTSQIPRLIDNFFTKILSCLKEKDIPAKSKSSDTKAALHFLPVIFQHASRKWKKYPQQCFQLLCFFLTSLGMPEEGQVEKIMDDHVATVSHLLSLVHDCGIYNVVADKIGGEVQLKYFRHVLQVLLQTDKHEDVCKCMLKFLQLNHLILEPYMLKVLDHCCSIHIQEQDHNKSYNLDVFMSELISTYSQLHQTPKWMNFILAYNDSNPRAVPMLFSLQTFSNRYGQVMCSLPYSTALDMWTKFVEQIHAHVQGFLNDNEASSAKLWGSTLLFHEFISHIRLFDASVTGKAVEKIQALQKELEEKIILPCKKLIIQKGKDELACRSCLLLAYCLGNVKVMLMQYKTSRADPDQFLVKENDLPFSLKPHELLKVKKSLDEDVVLHYLADLLTVQKLQAFEEVETMCLAKKPEVQSFLTFFKETTSCTDFSQTWNGSIATINNGNYLLAKFFHVAQKVPFLLPIMLLENCDDLSKFLVDIFSKPIICSPTKEGRYTLRSTAQMLLCNSAAAESRQLLSVLICTLWKEMCTEFSPPGSSESHKKKRTVPSKHQTVLCGLGESDVLCSEHSESHVQSVGQLVNAVLECEDVQPIVLSVSQRNLLQILHCIPLAYLPPGSQLQCILGLLTLLSLQASKEFTSSRIPDNHKPASCNQLYAMSTELTSLPLDGEEEKLKNESCVQQLIGDELCQLLKVLLDASAGTSVFCCVEPRVVVNFLSRLCDKCSAEEGSPLGLLLKKTVATVMADFQSVLALDGLISQLIQRIKRVNKKLAETDHVLDLAEHRQLLTVAAYILQESHWHLKKDFYRKDVQEASRTCFTKLSAAITQLVDSIRQRVPTNKAEKIPFVLMQCLTAVFKQHCADNPLGEGLETDFIQRVEFLLQNILDLNVQGVADEEAISAKILATTADLHFLSCVYKHHSSFSRLLTAEKTRAVWNFLQRCLCERLHRVSNDVAADTTEDTTAEDFGDFLMNVDLNYSAQNEASSFKRKQSLPNGRDLNKSPRKKLRKASLDYPAETLLDVTDSEMEEVEAEIKTTITDLVLSCDDDVFEELVDKSVMDVHVTNLSKPLLLQAAIKMWQSIVIHSKISVEQRNILEKLSIKYLLQTIPIMTELSILPNSHLNQRIEIQILNSFVTMLSVDKFLSFKGTMMCLESCFLLRLDEVSDARFFLSFHALYGVLHATLAHHPSSVLRIIPAFLTATKSLLRECILRSDQDKLAGQPVYLDNMVRCANCVSRLLALFAGHRTELHRVAAYLVSDYANWVKKVTLPPAVKKALLPGVYAFLDLCDKHALSQLRNMLPPGVREVFHLLHNDYLKYFKYTGKI